MSAKILIILGSARQNRQGEAAAGWVASARTGTRVPLRTGGFRRTAPALPRKARAAGYIFVTSEYSHGCPAALKNALDHLYHKRRHMPAVVISYGASGEGYRAPVLRTVPVCERVGVSLVRQASDAQEQPHDQWLEHAVDTMLDELIWRAATLKMSRGSREVTTAA